MSDKKVIILKSHGEPAIEEHVVAAGALTPGELATFDATGKLIAHNSAAGIALPMFVLENANVGKGITDNIAAADTGRVWFPRRGDRVHGLVAAAAAAISLHDPLESAGNGTVRKVTAGVATRAKVTIGLTDAAVEFEASQPGNEGNAITVEYLAATAAAATVTVAGTAIQIKPDSTTPGTTDQANDIVTLVNGSAEASALVVARAPGTGLSAVVTPVAATNLAGGTDAEGVPGGIIGFAAEAVDNSGGGAEARIAIRVA